MPRRITERKVGGYCKIRKRGCSSSTSSSSLVKNYRLKRAILVGKRAGSSTPVPTWKMALRSPSLAKHCHGVDSKASARRLAASLWELNGSHSPAADQGEVDDFDGDQVDRCRKSVNHSHSPVSKNKDGSKKAGHRRKPSAVSQKLQLTEYIGGGGMDSVTIEGAGHSVKRRLKEVSYSLAASKEIVKVLFRLWSQEEQNSSRLTLVSALRVEVDRARHQVDELVHEQRDSGSHKDVVESLMRQFAAEKAAWRSREEDRILEAVASMARELQIEKKLRRQSERLNKRLGRELADTRAQLEKAVKGLDCERRARGVLEQTCDELARGLGEDRAAAEELKRESQKVREEVERERQMLQLADVLREERVQMKLSEARYEFEEKNAALERLRTQLETYLGGEDSNGDHANGDNREFVQFLDKIRYESCQNGERDGVEEDSVDSELHSIELSMDNLNKSYKWSFAREQEQAESRRPSVEEVFKGRRSLSEQIQWENICLQRKTSDGIEWDFTVNSTRKQANANGFDKGRLSGASSQGEGNDHKLIKGCKDMAGSRGVRSCTSSRPESPLGKVPQANSMRLITLMAMEAEEAKDNFGARSSTKAE